MQNLNFLFAAYSLIWFALFLFLLRLGRKLTSLERALQRLEEKQAGS
ncbi:MAG TPA: CcmD family protein [bacterium]|nr:CcmD family protein [bacterium]HPG81930.1 CcmD family protein [bacterium]HPM58242.1 CcmD family protein [bacterium]